MKITKVTNRINNDFWATVSCEHCGAVVTNWSGYEDTNYHQNVMPKFHCKECGQNRAGETKALTPKQVDRDGAASERNAHETERSRYYPDPPA